MKPRKPGKKLGLSKTTVMNLGKQDQQAAKGGYWETAINTGCGSWHPICVTEPVNGCPVTIGGEICPFSEGFCETKLC
jgi:hypothetical protein